MTLEEIERLARKILDEVARGYTPDESWSDAVADALVAILPVVKAAEAWEQSLSEPNGGRRRIKEHEALWLLKCTIDAMRERMGEK